jgi:hypothetical protein
MVTPGTSYEGGDHVQAKLPDVRGLLMALQMIKTPTKKASPAAGAGAARG